VMPSVLDACGLDDLAAGPLDPVQGLPVRTGEDVESGASALVSAATCDRSLTHRQHQA
jgi:hypothetical protein